MITHVQEKGSIVWYSNVLIYKQMGTTDSTNNTIHTLLLSRKNEQTHHTQKDIAEIRVIRCPDGKHSKIGSKDKAFSVDVITGKEELI